VPLFLILARAAVSGEDGAACKGCAVCNVLARSNSFLGHCFLASGMLNLRIEAPA